MFRLGVVLFILLLIGTQLLGYFASSDVVNLVHFALFLVFSTVVLKVSLDVLLHRQKDKEDDHIENAIANSHHVHVYEDLNEYVRATREREENGHS